MGFNLEDYEDVATLNRWFQDNYPMGRIELEVISDNPQQERMVIMASIFRDAADTKPAVQNIARGKQEEYNRNMARFYGEDIATSAIGRAILLLKGAERTAHKEGVARAAEAKYQPNKFEKKIENFVKESVQVENPVDAWTIQEKPMPLPISEAVAALNDNVTPEQVPMCPTHNVAGLPKTGNTRGKAWKKYDCPQTWPNKCTWVQWMEIDKSGRWVKQKPRVQNGEL
jgi:hypothetical protein